MQSTYNRRNIQPQISMVHLFRVYIPLLLILVSLLYITKINIAETDRIIDVKYNQLTQEAKTQVDCLAENIYFEAAYEPRDGQIAVAMVTLNRVQDPQFPKDICGVVKQRTTKVCQFSWFCEGNKTIQNNAVYLQARDVALLVYANYEKMHDMTSGALFYHADYVNPRWKLERTTVIGRHIFYKQRD